jgi:histidinol-phosphate aminotransferase
MKNLANKQIQIMTPYCPPIENRRAYRGLLLDFNEKTVPPTPKVLKALKKFVSQPNLQIYPEYGNICARIAKYARTSSNEIMVTNGSDQGIDLVFRTFTKARDRVVIPKPSFAMFYQSAEIEGNEVAHINYKEDLTYPVDKVIAEIEKGVSLILICNPNNPTGILTPLEDIETTLQKALKKDTIVFVDEAYYEFSRVTAAPLLKKYPNLIISRTFSKAFGLAALRIGYLIANKKYIKEMLKVRGPYDINIPACVAAGAALDDIKKLRTYTREVMNEAKPMVEEFLSENKIEFFPSRANLILFRPKNPEKTFRTLINSGLKLRPKNGPSIDETLRLSIGTVKQMKKFIRVYKEKIL